MLKIVTIPTTAFAQNSRIIFDTKNGSALLVDPGSFSPYFETTLKRHQLSLKAVILTHGHLDHVGGAAQAAQQYEVPIIGPAKEDAPLIAALDRQAAAFSLPRCESFEPHYVKDEDELELLPGFKFKVLATPGHTPGGVCWYQKDQCFVLSGDTLFAGSVGRTDFPGGDFNAIERSIREKLYQLPDETAVLAGHGPDSTIGDEKRHNAFVRT